MEECSWIEAAVKVLVHAEQSMHYTDIKRVISEMGLVPYKSVFINLLQVIFLTMIILTVRMHGQQPLKTDIYCARAHFRASAVLP